MLLEEALESAKLTSRYNSGLITSDFYDYLYDNLDPKDRSIFIITLAEMGINTRMASNNKLASFILEDLDICKRLDEDYFSESLENLRLLNIVKKV
jgi:hypothetical protein